MSAGCTVDLHALLRKIDGGKNSKSDSMIRLNSAWGKYIPIDRLVMSEWKKPTP